VLGPSPYALATPAFRFKALALAAGRASLGGPRETALAVLIGARLAAATTGPGALAVDVRAARAEAARAWLGTIAVPAVTKLAVSRLIEFTARNDPAGLAAAVAKVTDVTAPLLDRAARSELDQLAATLHG
jgi:hypothetical protein